MKTIIEMIRSFGSIASGEKECFLGYISMNKQQQKLTHKHNTGEISMEKSEIRNTGRTPNGGVVGSKIPMEFKVERLETDSGDVISREEMKEMMKRLVIVMETQKEGEKEEKRREEIGRFDESGLIRKEVEMKERGEVRVMVIEEESQEKKEIHQMKIISKAPKKAEGMIAEEITSESFQLKWKIPRTTDEGTEIPMMFTVRTKDESGRVVKEKEKMREQECLIDGLRGSTKYSVVVISTPVFSSITDPSSSTSISEVLEVNHKS